MGDSSEEGQGATVRPREGSVSMGRGGDVGVVVWCVGQAGCEVSAAGRGEVGGRAASTSPHRLRSPPCSHTPEEEKKDFSSFNSLNHTSEVKLHCFLFCSYTDISPGC